MDKEERFKHDSYGLISFSRCQGNPGRLFGSSLTNHGTFIRLVICEGERICDLSHDRFHAGKRLIEVDLSASQFAELITTMNVGSGIPCTIRAYNDKVINIPHDEPTEAEKVQLGFEDNIEDLKKDMRIYQLEINSYLDKPTISKSDRKEIKRIIENLFVKIHSNLPFVLTSFREATERVVAQAKAEVDSFITHNILAEGLRSVVSKVNIPMLNEKKEKDDA